jgi:tetratricopeptide (TPR) repeat protein
LGAGVYINNPLVYRHAAVQPPLLVPAPNLLPGPFAPYPPAPVPDPWSASRSKRPITSKVVYGNSSKPRRPVKSAAAQINVLQSAVQSNREAFDRSLELQASGDEKLRQQKWSQACSNYRQSVEVAEGNAPAHFRLGLAYTAMRHFTLAVREFKRGLALDPSLPQSADRLATIFGEESAIARRSIQHQIATWVRDDIDDPDRLFLLGLWLHYDDDPRGHEVLEAALRRTGEADHIVAFLNPSSESSSDVEQKPLAIASDLRPRRAASVPIGAEAASPPLPDLSPSLDYLPLAPLPTPDSEE